MAARELTRWRPTTELLEPDKFRAVLITAPRDTGKSVMVRHLIEDIVMRTRPRSGGFGAIFVVSRNSTTLDWYAQFVPPVLLAEDDPPEAAINFVHFDEAEGVVDMIVARQQAIDEAKRPRILIVFDDCQQDRELRHVEWLSALWTQGRHHHVAAWIVSQTYEGVAPTIRKNCELVLMGRSNSGVEQKHQRVELIEGALAPGDPEAFGARNVAALARDIQAVFTQDYSFLVVDQRQKKVGAAHRLRWYRAPFRA